MAHVLKESEREGWCRSMRMITILGWKINTQANRDREHLLEQRQSLISLLPRGTRTHRGSLWRSSASEKGVMKMLPAFMENHEANYQMLLHLNSNTLPLVCLQSSRPVSFKQTRGPSCVFFHDFCDCGFISPTPFLSSVSKRPCVV